MSFKLGPRSKLSTFVTAGVTRKASRTRMMKSRSNEVILPSISICFIKRRGPQKKTGGHNLNLHVFLKSQFLFLKSQFVLEMSTFYRNIFIFALLPHSTPVDPQTQNPLYSTHVDPQTPNSFYSAQAEREHKTRARVKILMS